MKDFDSTLLKSSRIGFIGAGNMAQSLIGGMLAQGIAASQLLASDPSEACREQIRSRNIKLCENNHELVSNVDIVVLAIKPQVMRTVVESFAESFQKLESEDRPLFVSIAAGISCQMIEQWLAQPAAIVRCMPNTPSLMQEGATGMFANSIVSQNQRAQTAALMSAVGVAVWVCEEASIDAVTALSGSGPAYFFYMLESMIDKAEALGLDRADATLLAQQTALGAAKMSIESDVDIAELRRRVTSPKGTTEAAINCFAELGFAGLIGEGMQCASDRAKALEKELS